MLIFMPLSATPESTDPWTRLEVLRAALVSGVPQRADFVQTYTPAGFSSGDRESGSMAFKLPQCLRWDYELPYAKSFLLCDGVVHTWNPGEDAGRRAFLDPLNEPGFDLLILNTADLRTRYQAAWRRLENGHHELQLLPNDPAYPIQQATLEIDPRLEHLTSVRYRDRQGNQTEFRFTGYQLLAEGTTFMPPQLTWLED